MSPVFVIDGVPTAPSPKLAVVNAPVPAEFAPKLTPSIAPPSMLIVDNAVVPATQSAVCFIISLILLFTLLGNIPSAIEIPPTSVLLLAVAE